MRQILLWLTIGSTFLPLALLAQDRTAEAAARAQREEAEERYKLLNGKLESVIETQEMLMKRQEKFQQRLHELASEIDDFRKGQAHAAANAVTHDQLKDLVEKMQEIDKKRVADNDRIVKTMKELQKISLPTAQSLPDSKPAPPTASLESNGAYEYIVKKDDTLAEIVKAYNEKYKEEGQGPITVKQVLVLNPGLNPNKLYKGRKILIPKPPKKEAKVTAGK